MIKLKSIVFVCGVVLCVSCNQIEGLKFTVVPQNVTIISDQPIRLNCSADRYDKDGMDWEFGGRPIFTEINGEQVANMAGYKVDKPNNLTRNLIILHPNASFAGEYCCQLSNGQGKKECAFVTEENATLATEVSATQAPVTSVLSTTEVGKSDGHSQTNIIGITLGVFTGVLLTVLLVLCFRCRRCPLYKYRCKKREKRCRNEGAGTSENSQEMNELQPKEKR